MKLWTRLTKLKCAVQTAIKSMHMESNSTVDTENKPVIAAPASTQSPTTYLIELDEYEIANLREVIQATGFDRLFWLRANNPLRAIDTGDWLGQLYWKLPLVDMEPNVDAVSIAKNAVFYGANATLIVSENGMIPRD